MVEFRLGRKARIEHLRLPPPRSASRQHLGQAVIGLRAENKIDERRARQDFLALGLRDAAGDRDHHAAAPALARGFQAADRAEFGKDLFGRLLADMAGIEDDEVGAVRTGGRAIAERRQQLGHSRRVVDVHLAAISLDEQPLGHDAQFVKR